MLEVFEVLILSLIVNFFLFWTVYGYAVRGGGKRISPRTGPFYSQQSIRTPAIIVTCHQTPDIPDSLVQKHLFAIRNPHKVFLLDLQEINTQFSFGLVTNVKNTKASLTHDRVLTLTPGPGLGVDTLTWLLLTWRHPGASFSEAAGAYCELCCRKLAWPVLASLCRTGHLQILVPA